MPAHMKAKAARSALITLVLILVSFAEGSGASSPFEIDIRELDKDKPAPRAVKRKPLPPVRKPAGRSSVPANPVAAERTADGHVRYTVKQGDHIFRILMKEFGMSNSEAERLIPDILRTNSIADIRKLTVGRTLLIPTAKRRHAPRPAATPPSPEPSPAEAGTEPPAPPSTPAPVAQTETPEAPPASAAAPSIVQIHSMTASDPVEIVDSLLSALSMDVHKNRIVEAVAGKNGGNAFSVKVDRYFEEKGKRFIVNGTEKDPFNYTLLRLLEVEGYQVIQLNGGDNFRKIATRLLTRLNRPFSYVTHKLSPDNGGREVPGFLVADIGKPGTQILITDIPMDKVSGELTEKDKPGGK
ncbi:MAG: hypothetical protein FD174_857 [Geobacteraceae bacterium]|nr:MAG: hypothetical protein FD174_857 [Geobacteraceae bacterium]